MKHKTAELTGALLDAAVALADGRLVVADEPCWPKGDYKRMRDEFGGRHVVRWYGNSGELGGWEPIDNQGCPSDDWGVGGPIIEREHLHVAWHSDSGGFWRAVRPCLVIGDTASAQNGHTPLIAAMRAYVASRLGDEVELP